MTVVGIVSDTHFPRFGRALPRALERGLRRAGVVRVLHLGDMTDLLAVPLFEAIAPFDAVAGNNDGEAIRERFGRRKVVRVEDVRVGMVHGDGRRGTTTSRALAAFADDEADVVLFGHSHVPWDAAGLDGQWLHVGTPEAIRAAEERVKASARTP